MLLAFSSPLLAALQALHAAPEAAMSCLGIAAAALGITLQATLPPPAEDTVEATILSAFAAM
ncbi:hypothetical protein JYK14_16640 [Siccirubricoccus sp. KC 17139]|uniref:Uncharacterized protein n=1 Tax=Siccirubricoccus soli TaxID=2899147 RepID=A0ABT1D762_9PROT|nr:hypothetical protein [Siccirubricoccus soli]MCO6417777.1 hypothetical protein [Siccirubricoccus soli]MCP2683912.1 hypothetical protein [Siccirubricoccus soli]